MRKVIALLSLTSLIGLSGCSELKLANNRTEEVTAGQEGNDITHQVTERHSEHSAGAIGPAVSEMNTGTTPNPGKPDAKAGPVNAVERPSSLKTTGARANSTNGVPQDKH